MKKPKARVEWLWAVVGGLPVALPAFVAAFGTVATVLLLADRLTNALVWPLGLAAGLAAGWIAGRYGQATRPGSRKEQRLCDLLVLVGAVIWAVANLPFTSQDVFTNRDPATYAVAGEWLRRHDNLSLNASHAFAQIPGLTAASGGFAVDAAGQVYAQGLHLLPIFLGLAGRIGGQQAVFQANLLFGAAALLGVYGFARLLARPRWALAATAALAVSMPMIYLARDTYTEPLAAAFTFGSLSLLWVAQQKGRLRLWFLAGLVAGAGALTRIDAYLSLAALAVLAMLWLLVRKSRWSGLQVVALALGAAVSGIVGWLDLSQLSRPYYLSLHSMFMREIMVIVLVIIVGETFVVIDRRTKWLNRLDQSTRSWRGAAAALIVISFVLLLACRPFFVWYLSNLQSAASVPSGHSYAEVTTYFVAWYLGPILALLGVAGVALAAYRAATERRLLLIGSLLVLAVTAVVYLIKPSITPDQIWASRRLVPVILPGVASFAALALDWLQTEFADRLHMAGIYSVLTVAAILVGALFTSSPLALLRDTARLPAVTATCQRLPGDSAVVLVGLAGYELVQPLHAYCNLPSAATVGQTERVSQNSLAMASQAAWRQGKQPILLVYGNQLNLLPDPQTDQLTRLGDFSYRHLEHTYLNPPQHVITETTNIYYAHILPDGSLATVSR